MGTTGTRRTRRGLPSHQLLGGFHCLVPHVAGELPWLGPVPLCKYASHELDLDQPHLLRNLSETARDCQGYRFSHREAQAPDP